VWIKLGKARGIWQWLMKRKEGFTELLDPRAYSRGHILDTLLVSESKQAQRKAIICYSENKTFGNGH
jgi:hypothetical protein